MLFEPTGLSTWTGVTVAEPEAQPDTARPDTARPDTARPDTARPDETRR